MGTSGRPGHKILCSECSVSVRRAERAISTLSEEQSDAIFCCYVLPNNPKTKKAYTQQELANDLGIGVRAFERRLQRARKNLRKNLTRGA
jgi:DNA-directed RNA polymerase specialized sigma24 family protein